MRNAIATGLLAITVGLSAIACNNDDDTGGGTGLNQNQTPPCTSTDDCDSGQFCNTHATCQQKVTPGTLLETLTISITGRGSVTASDGTNTYGQCTAATCGYDIPQTATGTLTAQAATGWAFSAWGGDCVSTTASADITMNASKSCSVTFVETAPPPEQVTVSATASPTDAGTVTVNACDGATSCSVDVGTPVTFTAAPTGGARFDSWSGGELCVGTDADPKVVAFDAIADTLCTANFIVQNTVSVTVSTGCTATVTIDSCSAPGCQCSGDGHSCTADTNSIFSLTVSTSAGFAFAGWLDDAIDDTGVGACPPTTDLTQTTTQAAACRANCIVP